MNLKGEKSRNSTIQKQKQPRNVKLEKKESLGSGHNSKKHQILAERFQKRERFFEETHDRGSKMFQRHNKTFLHKIIIRFNCNGKDSIRGKYRKVWIATFFLLQAKVCSSFVCNKNDKFKPKGLRRRTWISFWWSDNES